jgi:hypothetical protein
MVFDAKMQLGDVRGIGRADRAATRGELLLAHRVPVADAELERDGIVVVAQSGPVARLNRIGRAEIGRVADVVAPVTVVGRNSGHRHCCKQRQDTGGRTEHDNPRHNERDTSFMLC